MSGYYSLYQWFSGQEAPANDSVGVLVPPLALFHSTAQATGPNLNAETFREALFQVETQQAISQPYLTWGDHGFWQGTDYNGIDDATLIWWDPDRHRPGRDPQGRHRHVAVRRGWQAVPARRMADRRRWRCSTPPERSRSTKPRRKAKRPIDYPSPAG